MTRWTMDDLDILFETPHELLVYKPPGMASELSSTDINSLKALLQRKYPQVEIKLPHRLDRITRGLLLAAKGSKAVAWHNRQIQQGLWEKYYIARIDLGNPNQSNPLESILGVQKAYLKREKMRAIVVRSGGKPSFIEVLRVKRSGDRQAYLLIRNITGRFHQIRAILANLGYPLTGDHIYHSNPREGSFFLESCAIRFQPFAEGESQWISCCKSRENIFSEELACLERQGNLIGFFPSS